MYSNALHWSRGIVVFIVMMIGGMPAAFASTWADYQNQAAAILDTTNQALNARLNSVATRSVKFTVEVYKSGGIRNVMVVDSSGDPNLDATTVDWVMAVGELPPPSTSVYLGQIFESLTFTFEFAPVAAAQDTVAQSAPTPLLAEPIAPPQPGAENPARPEKPATPEIRPVPDQQIMRLQQDLIAKGYNPGPVDGFYGANTARAIRDFQADQGVNVNGRVSEQLIALLAKPAARQSAGNTVSVAEPAEAGLRNIPGNPAMEKFSLDRELVDDYYYEEDKSAPAYDF